MSGNARYNGMESFAEWQQDWKNEDRYNFRAIEAKWQKIWEDEKAYKVEIDKSKPKFYALVEFPYPLFSVGAETTASALRPLAKCQIVSPCFPRRFRSTM